MCGLIGAVALSATQDASRMPLAVQSMSHRGPDDSGMMFWFSPDESYEFTTSEFERNHSAIKAVETDTGVKVLHRRDWRVIFGHRRLSIIDVTPNGHQPMSDREQRFWVVLNGTIYNYREIRSELEAQGSRFTSESDTEVLLQAVMAWGIDCISRLNGIFAFAIFDSRSGEIFLGRDRCGVKPLYIVRTDDEIIFASEIKAILAFSKSPVRVDPLALNEYFSFQNVFSDRTLFKDIAVVPAAHWMKIDVASGDTECSRYWDFHFNNAVTAPMTEMVSELECILSAAVKRQLVADVPVGSYLSGGLDSGSIAHLATKELGRLHTFTVGFDLSEANARELNFDERYAAEKISAAIKSEHYESVVHAGDIEASLADLVWHIEDLRVGQSYPNFYAARLASRFVKVVLSGAGGDELFGGYPWRYAAAYREDHESFVDGYYGYWQRLLSDGEKQQLFRPDILDWIRNVGGAEPEELNRQAFASVFPKNLNAKSIDEKVSMSLYFECRTFLKGILAVEDKLSSAYGMETRVPFLDNEIIDFSCRVPVRYKVRLEPNAMHVDENVPRRGNMQTANGGVGKLIVREAVQNIFPLSKTMTRKQGFSGPDESWFRGAVAEYVRETLLSSSAELRNFFDADQLRKLLESHFDGEVNRRLLIWSLLSFEVWLKTFGARTD